MKAAGGLRRSGDEEAEAPAAEAAAVFEERSEPAAATGLEEPSEPQTVVTATDFSGDLSEHSAALTMTEVSYCGSAPVDSCGAVCMHSRLAAHTSQALVLRVR